MTGQIHPSHAPSSEAVRNKTRTTSQTPREALSPSSRASRRATRRSARSRGLLPAACFAWIILASRSEAQPIENLGGDLQHPVDHGREGWVVYSVLESFRGEDLNGDRDAADRVLEAYHLLEGTRSTLRDVPYSGQGGRLLGDWFYHFVSEQDFRDLNGDGDEDDWVLHVADVRTGRSTNLAYATESPDRWRTLKTAGDRLVHPVFENERGDDLNEDGDQDDVVLLVRNVATGDTRTLPLALYRNFGESFLLAEDGVLLVASETEEGKDLNGDHDVADAVYHLYHFRTGEMRNLGIVAVHRPILGDFEYIMAGFAGDWLVFQARERNEQDLNGDGDTGDEVVHLHRLSTGETRNVGVTCDEFGAQVRVVVPVVGDWLLLYVSEAAQSSDLNGDGDLDDWVTHAYSLSTGENRNLGLAGSALKRLFGASRILLHVSEEAQGQKDLNEDGDTDDLVHFVHDLERDQTDLLPVVGEEWRLAGDRLVAGVPEADRGEDLNGDGDKEDFLVVVHDVATGASREVAIVPRRHFWRPYAGGDRLVTTFVERVLGEDLNGDGDTQDRIPHVFDLLTGETRILPLAFQVGSEVITDLWFLFGVSEREQGEELNGDGDLIDTFVHVHDLSTGETRNTGLAGSTSAIWGDLALVEVSEREMDQDLDRDGLVLDNSSVLHVVDLKRLTALPGTFLRGDCNDDGTVDISDAVCILTWLFLGGATPGCIAVTNTNGDAGADISDATYLLNHLFLGGPAPATPFPQCGSGTLRTDEETCVTSQANCPQ